MRELEDMVSELKEQIFRSKAKLQLLAEQVAGGIGTGAKIVIVHKNEMGANFLLTEANYYLDGQPLWQEVDEGGSKLTEKKEFPVWDGNIVEGSHTLTVSLVYKGNGTGVFKYLSAYTWRLKDAITFTAEPGKVVTINALGFESGNFTTPLEERPKIRF
ncbi:MAG TPA: dihydrolipoamide acetyltransferase, partial [Myxococcota bacterium]